MYQTQPGVLADNSRYAVYLTLNETDAADATDRIRAFARTRPSKVAASEGPYLVLAIGSAYWDRLYPQARPLELQPFPAMENGERLAPSTPSDLFLMIRGDNESEVFDLVRQVREELDDTVSVVEEIRGFRYRDSRDLTGFVDGTENPAADDRPSVALVGESDPTFSGGSYLHLQRYEHNLSRWNRLPLKAQEQTIGRTKEENVEFAGTEKSPHAHTKRASVKNAQGESIEIYRQSLPYGDSQRQGLMFISLAASAEPFRLMLQSMIYGDDQGRADDLLLYTRALTGGSYFVPSLYWLENS